MRTISPFFDTTTVRTNLMKCSAKNSVQVFMENFRVYWGSFKIRVKPLYSYTLWSVWNGRKCMKDSNVRKWHYESYSNLFVGMKGKENCKVNLPKNCDNSIVGIFVMKENIKVFLSSPRVPEMKFHGIRFYDNEIKIIYSRWQDLWCRSYIHVVVIENYILEETTGSVIEQLTVF